MDNVDNILELLSPKFHGSNQLPSAKSCVLKKRSFEPVKSFALDIELSAIPGKTIIRSSFTSELSLNKTKELVIYEKILVNNNEIPVDFPRSAVESVFSKFGKVVSIKMELIGLWQKALVEFELLKSVLMGKNSVWVAFAVENKQSWVFRNQHKTLLYTLPVGTTAYDLCVVICFADKTSKLAAIRSVPVFKSTSLQWAGLSLACCAKSGIYKKKQVPIAHPVSFGDKTWAQVAGGLFFRVAPLVPFGVIPSLVAETFLFASGPPELLADQVSGILEQLGSMKLMPLVAASDVSLLKIPITVVSGLVSDMVLGNASAISTPSFLVINEMTAVISPSSSKVLTTKVGGLESKIVALEVLVESVLKKLDHLCSVRHVCKVFEVSGWLLSIKLLFKNKLSVSILGLYADAFLSVWSSQAGEINSIIAKAVNESFFDPIWANSHGVAKTIDFLFVSSNLINAVVDHNVCGVEEFFDTDHWIVSVFVGLSGLLDIQLISIYKWANRDQWKFDFKGADVNK
ncbi:hypothetical protein G9A89_018751 [Geosiphon pyriformis]|nr:hypothetical protein G9A89_018751 [Geosiphon pyriformis]